MNYVIIIAVVFALVAVFSLIKKRFLAAGLWLVVGLGVYLLTNSIMAPIEFNEVRDARYAKIFRSLEAIGDVEKLYRSSKGEFAKTFDQLYSFIENDSVYLTQTREEKVKEYSKIYRITIEKEIKVTFPEEYFSEELAGKEATFKVKLHEIKVKELPEMDDEFAKDVSEFDTLDELKEDIKEANQNVTEALTFTTL